MDNLKNDFEEMFRSLLQFQKSISDLENYVNDIDAKMKEPQPDKDESDTVKKESEMPDETPVYQKKLDEIEKMAATMKQENEESSASSLTDAEKISLIKKLLHATKPGPSTDSKKLLEIIAWIEEIVDTDSK